MMHSWGLRAAGNTRTRRCGGWSAYGSVGSRHPQHHVARCRAKSATQGGSTLGKCAGAGLVVARAWEVALHVLEYDNGSGHLGGERPALLADVLVGGDTVVVSPDVRYPHDEAERGEEAAADAHRRVAGVLLREAAIGPQGDREECPAVGWCSGGSDCIRVGASTRASVCVCLSVCGGWWRTPAQVSVVSSLRTAGDG